MRLAFLLSLLLTVGLSNGLFATEVFQETFEDGDYVGWHRRPDQASTMTVVSGVLRAATVTTCCNNAHMLALDDFDAFTWGEPWRVCLDLRMITAFEGIATMGFWVTGPPEPGRESNYEMPPHTTPFIEANLRNPGWGTVEMQAGGITATDAGPKGVVAATAYSWQMSTWYRLCLAREGNTLRVYVDGVPRIEYPFPTEWLASFQVTKGAIILYGYRSTAEYDNITVDLSLPVSTGQTTWGRIKAQYR